MARKTKLVARRKPKKAKAAPLTVRCLDALKRHGPGTADAVARRVRAGAAAAGKALSALKKRALAHFTRSRAGENVWRKGPARR